MDVVVVGAGLAGLSAACHLARPRSSRPPPRGGLAARRACGFADMGGYRFDTGPTVLTMPDLVDECFAAVGRRSAELTRRSNRSIRCTARASPTARDLLVRHGREAMAEEIRAVCGPDEAQASHRFCDWLTELYELEMPNFIDRNYDSPVDLIRAARSGAPAGATRARSGDSRPPSSGSSTTSGWCACSASRRCTPGSRRSKALALYAVITYMDSVNGVFVPDGRHARAADGASPRRDGGRRRRSATAPRSNASC